MIKDKLLITPEKPGCYLMKNYDNNIFMLVRLRIYKRLSPYFRGKHFGKQLNWKRNY